MKRLISVLFLCLAVLSAKAEELEFSYEANADIVSTYIWRGLYEGGLSFQPEAYVGWTSEHTSFSFGTWWNVGASDWGFRSGLPQTDDFNPNTQLTKELDIIGGFNLWGATFGFMHYYYLDGTNFFNFGDINKIDGSAQTEVYVGYDFSTLFPDVDLQLTWNTRVSGDDIIVNGKRAYSTYVEASYCHHFEHDMYLTGVVGISPWRSSYTDGDHELVGRDFAVNNLTLRFDKAWELGESGTELSVYVQGTMNTCNLNNKNAIIHASGDNKLEKQKLMGAIGVRVAFGN